MTYVIYGEEDLNVAGLGFGEEILGHFVDVSQFAVFIEEGLTVFVEGVGNLVALRF